jgi:hypothetical protein
MRTTFPSVALAFGMMVMICTAVPARAQGAPQILPVSRIAAVAPGSIQGIVRDEKGLPVSGAVISALGVTTAVAVTDRGGRFELRTLSPGPYLIRAHLAGYVAPRAQVVEVRSSASASSAIAMRRALTPADPVLTAGVGTPISAPEPVAVAPANAPASTGDEATSSTDDHSETAWRLRHARRSVLKDVTIPEGLLADDQPGTDQFAPTGGVVPAAATPARFASNLFGSPFSGQVNLLTLGSFDSTQQLFSTDNFARGIAYLALGAPVGEHADWTVRAALTQGDIASWMLAGEYTTRAPATHRYDLGYSYSMQRYDGGSAVAVRSFADGSRSGGALYAFDTYTVSPNVTVSYGGRYARYDYLPDHGLLSPRASVTLAATPTVRISGLVSHRALAPGAEEFMPQADSPVWLPPQRTFSSLVPGQPLEAEHTDHLEAELEHDLAPAATVSVRAFHQHVTNQLITMFGVDLPGAPGSHLGHYFIDNGGDVDAAGLGAGLRTVIANRVHGSVEYTVTHARWTNSEDAAFALLVAPSAVRYTPERVHDVTTSVETNVPETATRVLVLYRISNAFATSTSDHATLDTRFDVQVRQSLPFMDFSAARWEALLAVRNFFRDGAPDQSVYDELLVVRPPKRIVGGLTLKF